MIQRTLQKILSIQNIQKCNTRSLLKRNYYFCSDDDFKPKSKILITDENAQNLIRKWVEQNDIVLFMKGTPQEPQCGYSNFVVQLLKIYGINNYYSINVLNDSILREQIKMFSNWPTYPQFYVKSQFIGGCDILNEMHQEGELSLLFQSKGISCFPE